MNCVAQIGPTAALTQIWCIFWSTCADESPFEQIEFRAPIHLAFYELQLGDLFLCPSHLGGSSSLSGELIVKVAPSVQRKGHAKKIKLSVAPGIEVEEIILRDGRWVLSARAAGERSCPVCGPNT